MIKTNKKIKLKVIFVKYGNKIDNNSHYKLLRILKTFKKIEFKFIIVENNKNESIKKYSNKIYSVMGNNSYNEFSGWYSSINKKNKIKNYDLICLATSALNKNYNNENWSVLDNLKEKCLINSFNPKI